MLCPKHDGPLPPPNDSIVANMGLPNPFSGARIPSRGPLLEAGSKQLRMLTSVLRDSAYTNKPKDSFMTHLSYNIVSNLKQESSTVWSMDSYRF